MKGKPTAYEDDTTPIEWIEAAEAHPGYRAIRERMETMLQKMLAELEQPSGAEKTAELRGGITALRVCLSLPKILRRELERVKGRFP